MTPGATATHRPGGPGSPAVVQPLDVLTCPLQGIALVEASAGTGKTWAICGLVLRLLVERELPVQQVLVVTFTNAATAELRERIRRRIAEVLAHLRGGTAPDDFVPALLARWRARPGHDDAALDARLDAALHGFDEAAVFTIHGFCQRALSDAPFSARMPLALELVADDHALLRQVALDFWRRHLAGDAVDPALAAHLAQCGDTPERFIELLRRRRAKPLAQALWPPALDETDAAAAATCAGLLAALAAAHAAARALWLAEGPALLQQLIDALPQLNATTYKRDALLEAAGAWDRLLAPEDARQTLAIRPARERLFSAAHLAAKTRKNQATPRHAFFDAAEHLLAQHAAAGQALVLQRLRLLRRLLDEGSAALHEAKRRQRIVAFDDMLGNLHDRLHGTDGEALAAALRQRYPAALIDEFQDTDPLQFGIFRRLYGAAGPGGADAATGRGGPVFFVGDPKQAIYSFRNADLHTYLQARDLAGAGYTLAHNQRSTRPLIEALNGLFAANPGAFMLPGLHYQPVAEGSKPKAPLHDATLPSAALQLWRLPQPDGVPLAKAQARRAVLQACAAEIARLVAAGRRGDIRLGERALGAGDIAVLVRTHAQGRGVRQALAALGVGCVELSRASVFHTSEAEDLERLLAAILEPTRERLLKAALATPLVGLDAAAIDALADDETALSRWVQAFAGWREAWLARGIGVLLRRLFAELRVAARLLARADGERRMTNLLHLAETLQQAEPGQAAPEPLLRWLRAQRDDDRPGDAAQLRLESDQHLVQIVTIHQSKGLEYPIVFCPHLWEGRSPRGGVRPEGTEYHDDDGRTVIDFRPDGTPGLDRAAIDRRMRAEQAAEDLRLTYVALTRAVHRCVLPVGVYGTGRDRSTREAGRSLLNWLAAGAGQAPDAWLAGEATPAAIDAAWTALADTLAPRAALCELPAEPGEALAPERTPADALAALPPPAHIGAGWRIGSYSSLAHGAWHDDAATDHDQRANTTAAGDVDAGTADGPGTGRAATAADAPADADDILRFPRGSAAGDCLHALFEAVDFSNPAGWPDAVAQVLARHGPLLTPEADGLDDAAPRMLQRLLADVLHTPLPLGTAQPLRLATLPPARLHKEMEFHLPARGLDATALNRLLQQAGRPGPTFGFSTLQGYLKGFIDLVLEHDGRYFVVDWKSNHLGDTAADYGPAALEQAMAAHGYHLQALLYSLALARHLQRRLPGYRHAQHFGGVAYLFVRGLRPGWRNADGSPCGLHFQRPDEALLLQLARVVQADAGRHAPDPAGARA